MLRPDPSTSATRRSAARVALGALAFCVAASDLAAQHHACLLRVKSRDGETGYRSRTNRCEGMFVGLQSAPEGIQVVSLVKGGLRFAPSDQALYIRVPLLPSALKPGDAIVLQGRGLEANLNWAFDASVRPDSSLLWSLKEVILPEKLTSDRIGVFGQTSASTLDDPVYVPLLISSREPDVAIHRGGPIELIVRIPGASAARWAFADDDKCRQTPRGGCHEATRLNSDGYFRIELPSATDAGAGPPSKANSSAPVRIAIYWRQRSKPSFNEIPEYLRVLRW